MRFIARGKRLGELSKYFSHILLLSHFLGLQNFFTHHIKQNAWGLR